MSTLPTPSPRSDGRGYYRKAVLVGGIFNPTLEFGPRMCIWLRKTRLFQVEVNFYGFMHEGGRTRSQSIASDCGGMTPLCCAVTRHGAESADTSAQSKSGAHPS